jgi:hypothetical protein
MKSCNLLQILEGFLRSLIELTRQQRHVEVADLRGEVSKPIAAVDELDR